MSVETKQFPKTTELEAKRAQFYATPVSDAEAMNRLAQELEDLYGEYLAWAAEA